MVKIIGIDLGTSNSAASVMEGGSAVMVPSAEGSSQYGKSFPSVVAFNEGQRLVGEPARRQAVTNPDKTITGAKRKMGRDFKYKIEGKDYSPQDISAFILQKIKKDAEAFLGEPIAKAVITVPAYFDDNQRQATKDAGQIAGLDVVRLVNEPTAACLAFGINKSNEEHKILVFDLGGGTLDVTVMDFGDGVFEVKSTSGDTELGGRDMDELLTKHLIDTIKKNWNVDISGDSMAMQRVNEAGEKAKIELSTVFDTEINLPFIAMKDNKPINFTYKITRAKLEEIVRPVVQKCSKPVEMALKDAKLSKNDITKVILIGGPTRMPIVQKFVEEYVGQKIERGVDPMEAVAKGAAIQAGILQGDVKDVLLLDVTPLSLGIETLGGVMTKLIEKNTTIPTKKSQTFSTAGDFQTSVDIKVCQGERQMANDNVLLGTFVLDGIPPAKRGMPQIEVTFDIDANGILNVSAKDKATNKEQKIRISAPLKMDEEEIKKKVSEAEEFAEQDKKRKELVETKNEAESLIYVANDTLEQFKDKITEEQKKEIDEKTNELRSLLSTDNTQGMKDKMEELKKKLEAIGNKMYQDVSGQEQGQQAPPPGGDESNETPKDEDTTFDAEFKKKDE